MALSKNYYFFALFTPQGNLKNAWLVFYGTQKPAEFKYPFVPRKITKYDMPADELDGISMSLQLWGDPVLVDLAPSSPKGPVWLLSPGDEIRFINYDNLATN